MEKIKPEYLPHYEYADYALWEGRWEIIYGIPYSLIPNPGMNHSQIMGHTLYQFSKLLENCPDWDVIMPVDYKIAEDTVVQPDVIIYRAQGNDQDFLTKTPGILFEILSPQTMEKDLHLKYEIYEKAGVKYYVIVDPFENQCSIYQLQEGKYTLALTTAIGKFEFRLDEYLIDFDFGKIW